jgi:uncharacterized membrane protein YesL
VNPWEERFPRLWAFGERVSVLVIGGLMFFLFSAAIITIPAAMTGVFATAGALVRPPGQGETIGRFWRGFRRSFGRSLLLGLIDLAVGAILWVDIRFFWQMGSLAGKVAACLFLSLGMVAALANVYAWPLLAWFPQPLKGVLKRSLLLAAGHPFHALGGWLGAVLVAAALVLLPGPLKSLPVLLGPGLIAYAFGFAAWSAMRRYAGAEDEFAE